MTAGPLRATEEIVSGLWPYKVCGEMGSMHPVQVIAVTGGKGGVGKTNVSVNLSLALADLGRRVMLLDADLGLAGQVWSQCHSMAFDFSVWEIFGALLYGGRVVVVPDAVVRWPMPSQSSTICRPGASRIGSGCRAAPTWPISCRCGCPRCSASISTRPRVSGRA